MAASSSQLQINPIQTLKDHKSAISKVSFSPNGRVLASSSADSYINLYSIGSSSSNTFKLNKKTVLSGHSKGISDFVWSSDSRFICSCSDNQLIIMWDIEKSEAIQLFPTPNTLQLNTTNIDTNSCLFLYDVFIENQISSSFSMNSSLHSNSNNLNNLNNPKIPNNNKEQEDNKDNNNNNMNMHNMHNMNNNDKYKYKTPTHNHYILCLALNDCTNIMASGSFDETVILWDVRNGKQIKILSAHSDPVCCLSFCIDGTMLLSAGYDGLIRGWDMSSFRCIKTLGFDPTPISFAKWTPNAQYIIAGTLNDTIRIWDFQTAKTVKTYKGHKNKKFCLFSDFINIKQKNQKNLNCIVCGSEDGFIYFWDIQTKDIVHKFKAHNDCVIATNFKSDQSEVFASGGLQKDNTVKVWQIV